MSTQTLLIGLPQELAAKPEQPTARQPTEQPTKCEVETASGDAFTQDIAEWIDTRKSNKENFATIQITAIVAGNLTEGVKKGFAIETAIDRHHRKESDTYGGMWGHAGISSENSAELIELIKVFVQKLLNKPYVSDMPELDHASSYLRDIHKKNVSIFISNKAKDIFEESTGQNFDAVVTNVLDNTEDRMATEKDMAFIHDIDKAEARLKTIRKEIDDIQENIADMFGIRYGYTSRPTRKDQNLQQFTNQKSLVNVHERYTALRKERTELEQKLEQFWATIRENNILI